MFDARLINDPFDDPGVFVELKYRREACFWIWATCVSCRRVIC